jgi:DNA-binding beta-propeller fold protein YncE
MTAALWAVAIVLILGMLVYGGGSNASPPLRRVLHRVRDVPLPGSAVRFDYQDLDPDARRLYVAHQGASEIDVVDLETLHPIAAVKGVAQVHGVRLAPDLGKVFATATAHDEVLSIDTHTLQVVGRAATGHFPDGVAYDPVRHLVAVSDKDDGSETLLDAGTMMVVRTVHLGQEVGNVVYDPTSGGLLVAVRPPDELVRVDPSTGAVADRVPLPGCAGAHGVAVDAADRLAFVACAKNNRLSVVDLGEGRQRSLEEVGADPDVLALDPGLGRLYVAAESGVVSVFEFNGGRLRKLGQGRLERRAHSAAVDPRTHQVFFPLEDVGGHPVLRVMTP